MDAGLRKPLEELTPAETRKRAREYRLVAATVPAGRVKTALLELARMLEQRVAQKEGEDAYLAHSDRSAFSTGYADGCRSIALALRSKSKRAPSALFRTAYAAGYDRGRIDADAIAGEHRTGLREGLKFGQCRPTLRACDSLGARRYELRSDYPAS
jgi:hypothetical protein